MRGRTLVSIVAILGFLAISGVALAADSIKVGAPLPMTGPYAGDGVGYYHGVKYAVDEINAAGGLLGGD